MTILRLALSAFLVLAICTGGRAQELPPDVLEQLHNMHHAIQTVSGSFVQEKNLAMFEQILISRGTFAIAKPGKIHWAYQEPTAFGFASDGKQIRRWNEQSGISKSSPLKLDPILSVIVDQMLAWSTMDTRALERHFSLALAADGPVILDLEPRAGQIRGLINRVRISLAPDGAHIQEIKVFEHDGDETRIHFDNVVLNQELPHGLF